MVLVSGDDPAPVLPFYIQSRQPFLTAVPLRWLIKPLADVDLPLLEVGQVRLVDAELTYVKGSAVMRQGIRHNKRIITTGWLAYSMRSRFLTAFSDPLRPKRKGGRPEPTACECSCESGSYLRRRISAKPPMLSRAIVVGSGTLWLYIQV